MCAECAETLVAALTKSGQSDRFSSSSLPFNLEQIPPIPCPRLGPGRDLCSSSFGSDDRSPSALLIPLHSSGVIPMQTPTLSLAVRSPGLEDLIEKARSFIHAAKSPATLRAYRTDFEDFTRFCEEHNLPYLPATPTTVALYITARAANLPGPRAAPLVGRLGHQLRRRLSRGQPPWQALPPRASQGLSWLDSQSGRQPRRSEIGASWRP
jgi:hypothetical protein